MSDYRFSGLLWMAIRSIELQRLSSLWMKTFDGFLGRFSFDKLSRTIGSQLWILKQFVVIFEVFVAAVRPSPTLKIDESPARFELPIDDDR